MSDYVVRCCAVRPLLAAALRARRDPPRPPRARPAHCVPGASRGGAARAQPPLRAEGHILGAISDLASVVSRVCFDYILLFAHAAAVIILAVSSISWKYGNRYASYI